MILIHKRHWTNRRNLEILFIIITLVFACILIAQHLVKFLSDAKDYHKLDEPRILRTTHLKSLLKCHDQPLHSERLQYGSYWLLKNFIRGRLSINMGCSESITYTTNGDYTFIENLGTVVTR